MRPIDGGRAGSAAALLPAAASFVRLLLLLRGSADTEGVMTRPKADRRADVFLFLPCGLLLLLLLLLLHFSIKNKTRHCREKQNPDVAT